MSPNPDTIFPVTGCKKVTYVRPTINNPNIIVGDFTHFSDTDFEKHVLHHYDFNEDRLIIGKFCQIAARGYINNERSKPSNELSYYLPILSNTSAMRKLLILLLLPSIALLMQGQNKDSDEYFTHNRASITGALTTSDAYQLQFSYHYMFWKYFGVGGSFGWWKNWYEDGWASGSDWSIDDDDNKPGNLYLRPSIILRSPAIDIGQVALSLYAEPGIMLNVPYQRVCIEKTTGLI